jgi:hypothetical protein
MTEPPIFLPTLCPECEGILSPAEEPKAGDRARCPFCLAELVYSDELVPTLAQ